MSLLLGEVQGGGFSPAVMTGVLDVMERHGLRPPRTMLLLSRTLLTLEGTLKVIDPEFNLPGQATELVAREGYADLGSPEEIVRHELVRALPALRTLPEHAEALAGQLRSGRLSVRSERYAGGDRDVVNGWMDRVLVAAGGRHRRRHQRDAAGRRRASTSDTDVQTALWILGFSGLTASTVLLMRTIAQALHAQSLREPSA